MKFKNAGFKTVEDAICAVVRGEPVYTANSNLITMDFDPGCGYVFKVTDVFAVSIFGNFSSFQTPITWEDEVREGNPVLCWCWNDDNDNRKPYVVTAINDNGSMYKVYSTISFANAEPVLPGDLYIP